MTFRRWNSESLLVPQLRGYRELSSYSPCRIGSRLYGETLRGAHSLKKGAAWRVSSQLGCEASFSLIENRIECRLIMHGEVSQHAAVDFDVCFLQTSN